MEVPAASLAQLWSLRLGAIRRLVDEAGGTGFPLEEVDVLAPIDGRTEVWACGVTYEISREARVEESERAADAYELVYDADRPELFFKSAAWRVVGDGGAVAVRSDSTLDVPEPEVALVINAWGDVVGYTICDDVSSRSIEGENPLYLPQAKNLPRELCARAYGAARVGGGRPLRPWHRTNDPSWRSRRLARDGEHSPVAPPLRRPGEVLDAGRRPP